MDVAIIGSGNVATVLSRVIRKQHRIVHVFSRDTDHASTLAAETNSSFSSYEKIPSVQADIFIISVSDIALEQLTSYHLHDKLIVHTAGSVAMDVLKNVSKRYGVLYPLQTLRREMQHLPQIPFLIDGNTEETRESIRAFASSFSEKIEIANDEERIRLHTAAVIVSNFTNHLYALAEEFCNSEKVSFDLLKPLILETAQRVNIESPAKLQTGPAIRKDILTLDRHLKILANYPKLRLTYMRLTDSIMHH